MLMAHDLLSQALTLRLGHAARHRDSPQLYVGTQGPAVGEPLDAREKAPRAGPQAEAWSASRLPLIQHVPQRGLQRGPVRKKIDLFLRIETGAEFDQRCREAGGTA